MFVLVAPVCCLYGLELELEHGYLYNLQVLRSTYMESDRGYRHEQRRSRCVSLYPLLLVFLLLGLGACSQSDTATIFEDPNGDSAVSALTTILGDAAKEAEGYYFGPRTGKTVEVLFDKPFMFVPNVTGLNPSLQYTIDDVSEWGFTITLEGSGFWKDVGFKIEGNLADTIEFCRDTDGGNDTFYGGHVYASTGSFSDTCVEDEFQKILREVSCDGTKVQEQYIECEYNCYKGRPPAFCVNDENVKEPCDDQIEGTDFFTKDFVAYNGRRYYDYCIDQIHGTQKELTEYTCEGTTLREVNRFCEHGCANGRCLTEQEFVDPTSLTATFFAQANSTNIDDWITLEAFVTDKNGLSSLHFYEFNGTEKKELTWESCGGALECNGSWRVARYDAGLRSFGIEAVNQKNYSNQKNLTLNFSGDLTAPTMELNITPLLSEVHNFTYFNITTSDEKGMDYLAIFSQTNQAKWTLLNTVECRELLTCNMSFRYNNSEEGLVRYIVKGTDTSENAAFLFEEVFYLGKNSSVDVDPPVFNFTPSIYNATVNELVLFSYEIGDEYIDSVRFYKQQLGAIWVFLSTFTCDDVQQCEGEFTYRNSETGNVSYLLNVTDISGNYAEEVISVIYNTGEEQEKGDIAAPNVSLVVTNVDDGVNNYTELEYSAEDDDKITYINLYEYLGGSYSLLRTKFCFRQATCDAVFRHDRLKRNTTFLVVAVDVAGNSGKLEEIYGPLS
jgi:hypothetical protein